MKQWISIGVEFDPETERDVFNRLVASWNESHQIPYKDGSLRCLPSDSVAGEFAAYVNKLNREHGAKLTLQREEYVEFEPKDMAAAELLLFCINGFAGRGAREIDRSVYRDSPRCKGCGYFEVIAQVKPLTLSYADLKHKDFMDTSHLETIVSSRAREILESRAPGQADFRPVTFVDEPRSRGPGKQYYQLVHKVRKGHFASRFQRNVDPPCEVCRRPRSVTTGRKQLVVDRSTVPSGSIFLLDEPLGSSGFTPSRSLSPMISPNLFSLLKKEKLTGFYGEPVALV